MQNTLSGISNRRFESDMAGAGLAAAVYAGYNMDCVISVCARTRHAAQLYVEFVEKLNFT